MKYIFITMCLVMAFTLLRNKKINEEKSRIEKECLFVDQCAECVPLIQPIMCFQYSKLELDSIRDRRRKELEELVSDAKNSNFPMEYYFNHIYSFVGFYHCIAVINN